MKHKFHIRPYLNFIKPFLVLILCLLGVLKSKAQEQFQLTNYIYSIHAINPAFTGIEDAVNVSLGFRRQWAAIEEAPLTYYVGFNGSLNGIKNANPEKRTLRKSVPRLYKKIRNEPGSINHGVGLYVSGNSFGPFRETSAYFTYSFMYQLNKDYLIAFGLSAEYANQRFVADKIELFTPDLDNVYQNYSEAPANSSHLNFNGGALLYGKNLYAGYSLHQFASIHFSGDHFTEAGNRGLYHFFTAGYNAILSPQLIFQPSTLVKYNKLYNWQIDVVAKLKYRDLIWGGLSWRYDDSIGLIFGFKLEKSLYLSYSYEHQTGDIGKYAQGTHELALGYRLFSDRLSTPFLW